MRWNALYLVGGLAFMVLALSAGTATAQADRQAAMSVRQAISAYHCASGSYWQPDAYARHGKFRPGHCTPSGAGIRR
jgi:hypothetical protein